ncbi:hypothetical protein AAE478_004390 [Parahypoxylon ruwenzoriense]
MVADFEGVLEPGEVHLCFSSKLKDSSDEFMDRNGMDVLVSRCPARLPSGIQKVTAVFRKELRHPVEMALVRRPLGSRNVILGRLPVRLRVRADGKV